MKKTLLKIRVDGDPCLRKRSDEVEEVGISERILIDSMLNTMYNSDGVGLAAPQVGINKRIFVFDVGNGPAVVANPRIIKKEGLIECEEGCLSVPNITINIKRPEKINVSYINENNEVVKNTLVEMSARVFLHEFDHLEGKLILDYASDDDKKRIKEQLDEIHEQQKEQ